MTIGFDSIRGTANTLITNSQNSRQLEEVTVSFITNGNKFKDTAIINAKTDLSLAMPFFNRENELSPYRVETLTTVAQLKDKNKVFIITRNNSAIEVLVNCEKEVVEMVISEYEERVNQDMFINKFDYVEINVD